MITQPVERLTLTLWEIRDAVMEKKEKMTCIDWLGREIELEKMCRVIKERDENVLMSEERVEKVEGVF